MSDQQVARFARLSERIIITLDEDFAPPSRASHREAVGVIYLDLPNSRRYIPSIQTALGAFFEHHADTIDITRAIVVIREDEMLIHELDGVLRERRPLIP